MRGFARFVERELVIAPLVEPAAELSAAETRRYGRHLILPGMGPDGQKRLKNARVLVIGAGGLGSPVLTYLAAAGVGTIGIVDDDVVDESNLHRQVIHGQSDLGRLKVDSAADSISEINPFVKVEKHPFRVDTSNALQLFADYDLVIDGTDNFASRYLINDAAVILKKPEVWGSIFQFTGQTAVFWAEHGPNYRDVFPVPPGPGQVPSCAEGGVLGVLVSSIGSIMATEAVKLITGIGEPLIGRLLVHDARAMTYSTIPISGSGERVTELLDDYEAFCGVTDDSEEPTRDEIAITVSQLKTWLDQRATGQRDFILVDVREPGERAINRIEGSVLMPPAQFFTGQALEKLPSDQRVVLYCRSGVRSATCLEIIRNAGFTDAVHVDGGVNAWIAEIEPHQITY